MDLARATSNRKSSQLQHSVIMQAEKLMIAARRWLRVKAEIGRRLERRRDDAADFDREGPKPSICEPASVERGALGLPDAQPASAALCSFPNDGARATPAGRPSAAEGATDQAPGDRRTARRQAEADMRAAMKAGDLDGVRSALSRMAPRSTAPN